MTASREMFYDAGFIAACIAIAGLTLQLIGIAILKLAEIWDKRRSQ